MVQTQSSRKSKLYRLPDLQKNKALVICVLFLSGFGLLLSAPDYKSREWLPTWRWPHQLIGETDGEYFFRSAAYLLWYPFSALRAGILLNSFKIHYALFAGEQGFTPPEDYGGYVLSLQPQQRTERIFLPAKSARFYFDLDADGDGDHISWFTENSALLFFDKNGDGLLNDGSELPIVGQTSLWVSLQQIDMNGDQVIDRRDPLFSTLKFCRGGERGKCISSQGQVYNVSEAIKQIDLRGQKTVKSNAIRVNRWRLLPPKALQDHYSAFHSSVPVTLANGSESHLYLMFFDIDTLNSYSPFHKMEISGDKPNLDLQREYLQYPNFRSLGHLPDLHVAMYKDSQLKKDVLDFASLDADTLFLDPEMIDERIRNILFAWAEVDGVDPDSRGWFIDGRILGFLEKMMGEKFYQLGHYYHPMPYGAENLKISWQTAFSGFRAQLLLQSQTGLALYPAGIAADRRTRTVKGKGPLSRAYLEFLVENSRAWPRERRRLLLQMITDMIDHTVVIYPGNHSAPRTITKKQAKLRNDQLSELERFRVNLFPETHRGE